MEKNNFKSGFVAIVGETNSGKSTLLNAFLGSKVSIVSAKPHTTRTRILGVRTKESYQIVFVDTPGFVRKHKKKEMTKFVSRVLDQSAQGVDLVLFIIDVNPIANGKVALKELINEYLHLGSTAPLIVVINKIDTIGKSNVLPVIAECHRVFKDLLGKEVPIVPISALRKDGTADLEKLIISQLPEAEKMFPDDVVSDQAEEFFSAEIIREKVFSSLNKELPYSTAVRIEKWDDGDELIKIYATIFVERDSQKSIVIGKGGQMLKHIGQAARLDLEKIYKCKVYLELFVKVEDNWTDSLRGLQKVGYIEE
ncbi:MAG: GTPase Era [Proteobacteria bacterium]|nr:GTPase Era [Pseudomonadota bacterium]